MGRIDTGRVIVGGLLAGLLINVSEFILNTFFVSPGMQAAMKAMNLAPIDTRMMLYFVAAGFALGVATVWLYAAIRPRFGPGVATATYGALAVWFLAYLYPTAFLIIMHVFPRRTMAFDVLWGLPEIVIAGIAGAWAYTEA